MRIVQVPVHSPFDSNVYLVLGAHSYLVDSGSGRDFGLCDRIEGLLEGRRLDAVLLTHCHADHAAGALEVSRRFGCAVLVGQKDLRHVSDADYVTSSDWLGIDMWPTPCRALKDGDVLPVSEAESLEVIDTPGHTEGGVCYLCLPSHDAFTGDTLFSNGPGRMDLPTGSPEDMVRSLTHLTNINIKRIYPGHGSLCEDGNASAKDALGLMR